MIRLIILFLLTRLVFADGITPIENLKLTTDADGGGNIFSNTVIIWSESQYIDLITSGMALAAGPSKQAAITDTGTGRGIFAMGYQADDYSYGVVQMPHGLALTNSIRTNLVVYPHVHWSYAIAPTEGNSNVTWKIEWEWANMGEGFNLYGSSVVTVASFFATNSVITSFAPITNNRAKISSIFRFKLSRIPSASNSYPTATRVMLDEFDMHVPIDRIGSGYESHQ
jgi:hypothetical protein